MGVVEARVAPVELGYAPITSSFATTSNEADVSGLSVAVVVEIRPVIIEVWGQAILNNTTGQFCQWFIKEGTTQLAASQIHCSVSANLQAGLYMRARLAPSSGSHTYKVTGGKTALSSASTATLAASAAAPAFIRVFEV